MIYDECLKERKEVDKKRWALFEICNIRGENN